MRIALLTSRARYEDPLENFFQHGGLSLGPFYLEAYLKAYGPESEVFLADSLQEVLKLKPDLVGISAVTQNFTAALAHARTIKETLSIPVVVGGPHISALPKSLSHDIDVAVLGEGEETFRQLILAYEDNDWNHERFGKIDGLAFHHNGQLIKTKYRPPLMPLDRIPKPRRVAWAEELGIAHVMSSRGCPFTCTFCVESEGVSRYRRYGVPVIVDEIKELVEHFHVKSIRFFDDVFNLNLKHVTELAEALQASGLTEKVCFGAWSRASTLSPEMLQAMLKMNMRHLAFGFESGSEKVLASLKTATKVADNQRAIDLCFDAGIFVSANFIIGTPGETHADLDATYRFIERNRHKLASVEITPLVPLPGAPLWDWALANGYMTEDFSNWAALKNQSSLGNFNPDEYLFMNNAMTKEEFTLEVTRFAELWLSFAATPLGLKAAKVIHPDLKPARLRETALLEQENLPLVTKQISLGAVL